MSLQPLSDGLCSSDTSHVFLSVSINPQRTFVHIAEPSDSPSGLVIFDIEVPTRALDSKGEIDLPDIFFYSGTARLQDSSDPALDAAALLLQQRPSLLINVVGHTDNQGGDAFNLNLSRQRAEAVVNALASRGVDAGRLGSRGMGMALPVADNATEEGRARNRRVELVRR